MSTNGEDNVFVEVAAHEPEPPRVVTTRRILIWVAVIAVLALVAGRLLYHRGYDAKTVPQFLVGEWTSDHPEYSDRYVTLTGNSITFGVGGTSSVKYAIIGIQQDQVDGVDTIVLHFRDASGVTFKRSVVQYPTGTRFFFASQPAVIWQRYGS
jgi:hypothetical protein